MDMTQTQTRIWSEWYTPGYSVGVICSAVLERGECPEELHKPTHDRRQEFRVTVTVQKIHNDVEELAHVPATGYGLPEAGDSVVSGDGCPYVVRGVIGDDAVVMDASGGVTIAPRSLFTVTFRSLKPKEEK